MASTAVQAYERKLHTPQRSWHIKRSAISSAKSLKISEKEQDVYGVRVYSSTFKPKTTISNFEAGSTKRPVISAAEFNSKELTCTISLGEPDVDASPMIKVEEDVHVGMLGCNFKFRVDGQLYAWQCTCRHSIRIPSAGGLSIAEETNGQDRRLIKFSAAEPQMDDKILAVSIRQRNDSRRHGDSGAANLHWFESVAEAMESASLSVIMGILERERRGAKEYSSGTSLLFG